MTRPKIGFLPLFFTVLTIAFCVVLWLRLRSYSSSSDPARLQEPNSMMARSADASAPPPIQAYQPAPQQTADGSQTTGRPRRTVTTSTMDWKIVPVDGGATTKKSAPATTGPANPAAKPSLLSRLVSPIVNAISGGGSKPQTSSSTAGSHSAQSQQTSSSGSSTSSGHTTTDTTGTTGTTDPKDRTSDTQPPQLVAISFTPAQVHDGEETVLAVQATDDLSGVRSISGTIVAPSGAVQGFACQRQGDGSDTYLAHIAIPKDAAEGVWSVNYLSLIDNASNAATISGAQGALPPTASFRVISSSSDSQGPTLNRVWLDRPAMKAGEKNTVFVDAEDDKSGVNLISGVFLSPAKHARLGFVCRPGTGPWECDVTSPTCVDCGDWQLEQVQLQDKANNMTTVRSDNPLVGSVRLNISADQCDNTPPTLQSIVLDRTVVSNVEDSVISVTAIANDDACGLMSMSGQVSGPTTAAGSPRLYFSFTPSDPQTWIGRITVPKLAAKGTWRVSWIQVLDQAHNLKTYSQGDPPLANAAFNVQ